MNRVHRAQYRPQDACRRSALGLTWLPVRLGLLGLVGLATASCATVDYASPSEFSDPAAMQRLALSQPEIETVLSLEEALKRSFVYNVSYRLARDKAVQSLQASGLTPSDYLPRVTAYLGQTTRSNQQASVGQRVDDMGAPLPNEFFTASDQTQLVTSLSAAWSVLDFGLAALESEKAKRYAMSEQQASRSQCHALAADVVSTYWIARAYERAEAKSDWLRWRIETALDLSREAAESTPDTRNGELMFQRELIDLYRWYDSIFVSVSSAKPRLASLMNLPAGAGFDIDESVEIKSAPQLAEDDFGLVRLAFSNRPEITQRLLQNDVNRISDRQDLIRVLPNLAVIFGGNTDSNSFLLNNSYTTFGANLSWNLFELARLPQTRKRQNDRRHISDLETQLVASAIASQVVIAKTEFEKRDMSLTYAWKANTIQAEIVDRKRAEVEREDASERHLVKEELLLELAILRRDIDEAHHQSARMRLLTAVGDGPDCSGPVAAEPL